MKKIKKTPQTVPIDTFAEAFLKLMKCTREQIHIEMLVENHSAFVVYKEEPFKINTHEYLLESVKSMLTDIHEAQRINPSIWAEVSLGVLSNPLFYINLIDAIEDNDQAILLQLVISISSILKDNDDLFWLALERADKLDKNGTLYGSAIVAAASLYDIDSLADDLFEAQIVNGEVVYNHFEGGIFKEVNLPVNGNEDYTFYIYSAMP